MVIPLLSGAAQFARDQYYKPVLPLSDSYLENVMILVRHRRFLIKSYLKIYTRLVLVVNSVTGFNNFYFDQKNLRVYFIFVNFFNLLCQIGILLFGKFTEMVVNGYIGMRHKQCGLTGCQLIQFFESNIKIASHRY